MNDTANLCGRKRNAERPISTSQIHNVHANKKKKIAVRVIYVPLKYATEDNILNAHANVQTVASGDYWLMFRYHFKRGNR